MNKPKVSFIVPVYKAEGTLAHCVDSILAQTYTDFELLLIDDGSPDSSGILCDEYAKKDPRVRVFHKSNGGVSSARNLGLDNAQGEWISFVDSDDTINNAFLETALRFNTDIVALGNVDILEDNTVTQGGMWNYKDGDILVYNEQCNYREFIERNFLYKGILQVVWSKIIRKEKINDLRFNISLKLGEDVVFSLQLLDHCNSLTYIHGRFYDYYIPVKTIKYKMNIEDASIHLKNIVNNYDNNKLNIPKYFQFEFKEKFEMSLTDIKKHPIKYLNSEGFIIIAHRINGKNPKIYLTKILFNYTLMIIKRKFNSLCPKFQS